MRAAVFQRLHRPLTIETLGDPEPVRDQVVIRVGRCGICGSDLHMTKDPAFGCRPGDVLGHEFAGEVVALGKETERLKLGDRVSVIPLSSCGRCPSCLAGEPAWCSQMALQGGGYAELALTSERQCVLLPKTASIADGAIVEPLAVALHGIMRAGLQPGAKALVLGAGPIGLATAYWARRLGASQIVVQDIARHQEERALAMGATHFISDPVEPVPAADRVFGGKADVVFECVGVPGLIAQAVEQTRVKGTVVILGLCTRPDTFVPFRALSKELNLVTSAFFKRQEYEASLDALNAGSAEPALLVTDTVSLAQVPEIFEALRRRTHQCKVLIAP